MKYLLEMKRQNAIYSKKELDKIAKVIKSKNRGGVFDKGINFLRGTFVLEETEIPEYIDSTDIEKYLEEKGKYIRYWLNITIGNNLDIKELRISFTLHEEDFYGGTFSAGNNDFNMLFKEIMPTPDEIITLIKDDENELFISDMLNSGYIEEFFLEDRRHSTKRQKAWEKHWDNKIKENPTLYQLFLNNKLITPYLEKKWKHLGADFGFLDD